MEILTGKVVKGVGGLFDVRCEKDGHAVKISCRARKNVKRLSSKIIIGDVVDVTVNGDDSVIERVSERKNSLIRPPVSNIDCLFITFSTKSPTPVLSTVDKMTAIAEHNGIVPVIVITKSDLSDDSEKYASVYRQVGYRTFICSSVTDDGIKELRDFVNETLREGKTGVFSGASGVGKSSVMNVLFPNMNIETGSISRIERGRHTTRHVELYEVGEGDTCGFIADTPGFSILDFEHFDFFSLEDLLPAFPDLAAYSHLCRYDDCTHIKEEECGIREAEREGKIAKSRAQSYRDLYKILKEKKNYK